MKKTLIIFMILFTVMFSFNSFADWSLVTKSFNGKSYFIDFERITKNNGYVYFWWMVNYEKPYNKKFLSSTTLVQADCKEYRGKSLTWSFYSKPMGKGDYEKIVPKEPIWTYPNSLSVIDIIFANACRMKNT